jgi:hypothetical protein
MFKRNIFKFLAIVFFLLAGTTFYNSNKISTTKTINNKSVVKKILTPTKISTQTIFMKRSESPTPTNIPLIQPTTGLADSINLANSPTNIPPTSTPQNFKISLKINDLSVGSIDVSQGANQCDVLSQALLQGKIQSLNMRYNNDLGTNAVYQINGIGKENSVWWTFKVNGQSPSQGCSYIKVGSNDNAEWSYIGN